MAGPTVEFLGRQPDEAVSQLVSRCQALLFPGEEDFGMAPLEVNAAGRPVIAFYGGGAVETITEGVNGMFFHEPTVDSMMETMSRFRLAHWDVAAIQRHARSYDIVAFQQRIREFVEQAVETRRGIPA
jgi:glycosyltransferase involved in cell wall biosynthesis